jgi:heme exporter protein A
MASAAESAAFSLSCVEVEGVYKDYGTRRALADVSLRLEAGRITTLLGDNGAGKSTLLGILSTLIRPSRGRVLYDGVPVEELDPRAVRLALGVLAHEPRCYADLSPRENLRFFGRLAGTSSGASLASQIDRWLSDVNLTQAADRPARTLSRGMLQRLAIAKTLFARPQLVLLDEPYTGLDRGGVVLLSKLITAERERGAIVVVISHDLEIVGPLADQAIVLARGRVAASAGFEKGQGSGPALIELYQRAAVGNSKQEPARTLGAAP